MSAYEELVERIEHIGGSHFEFGKEEARAILAEVLRTLETVTPDMAHAGLSEASCNHMFRAMLHASPLSPPITTS